VIKSKFLIGKVIHQCDTAVKLLQFTNICGNVPGRGIPILNTASMEIKKARLPKPEAWRILLLRQTRLFTS